LIREAIILSGGLGTRLKDIVPGLPKTMAPVAGRPFLFYIINYLRSQGIEKFIFSLGYKSEIIKQYLLDHFSTLQYEIAEESEPLGTGGAILNAIDKIAGDDVLVVNGDTLFKFNLDSLEKIQSTQNAICTIALKRMQNTDRYGVVALNEQGRITGFSEKKFYKEGLINGGIYLINRKKITALSLPEKFSFETDFLEKYLEKEKIFGLEQDGYFIDIGIPGDFAKAQEDLAVRPLSLQEINGSWSLFIDRDGVINPEKKDGYILNWDEFSFYPGAIDAFVKFSKRFGKIFIVSNQRGVGKKLMTEKDLLLIHENLEKEILEQGGRVDRIYYCTEIEDLHPFRKPNPGMAFKAKKDYPEIDLSKSIMVGNKLSDMAFGKNAGMFTIYLKTTHPEQPLPHPDIDLSFNNLEEFARIL
jgi:D-glycero-alpha-D-manno-heptose 1-phosphate guanylyltransferase